MIFQLNDKIMFPDPRNGEEDGFFAIGGDLSIERLKLAYSYGIFPWYSFKPEDNMGWPEDFFNPDGTPQIRWYCPMDRFVIFPDEIHVSHSMRTLLNKNEYRVTIGNAFEDVMRHCAEFRIEETGAWLGPHIIEAYTEMYRRGYATSVEVWDKDDNLVGGLYGVCAGRCFIGESMFSRVPSGSKIALIHLARLLQATKCECFIDCQLETPHLKSMGGRHINYDEYLRILHMS